MKAFIKPIIIGAACYLGIMLFFYLFFGKALGYETVKEETHIELLEVTDLKENEIYITNGGFIHSYYVVLEYENLDYIVKVKKELFEKTEIGDYIECKIVKKEKKNGYNSANVLINFNPI